MRLLTVTLWLALRSPRLADRVKFLGPITSHRVGDEMRRLDHRRSEALAAMPGNVAVQGPDARVVEGPRDGKEPVRRHRGRVAARRVLQLPPVRRPGLLLVAGREDEEVVSVEVDGVGDAREGRLVFDDEDDPFRLALVQFVRRDILPDLENVV